MPLLTQCPPSHGGVTPSLSNLRTSREHLPASILIGQCRRYQPLNLLPCLVIIILLTVIIYGLTHSQQHSCPGTVPAPVCPQPLGFLLLLLHRRLLPSAHPFNNGIFWLLAILGSFYPQPWLLLGSLGICQSSLWWDVLILLDWTISFPSSSSLNRSGLAWP